MRYPFHHHRFPTGPAVTALALMLAACGDDDATVPAVVDLVGQWDYVISEATGVGVNGVCSISNVTLVFTRSGGALAGTVSAAGDDNLVCVSGSTTRRPVTGTAALRNIVLDGSNVAFEFSSLTSAALSGTTPVVSTGTLSGNGDSMSGTVGFSLLFQGAGSRAFTGSWTATRR